MTANIKAITMPKWGMEMSEGEINAWYFNVGDKVTAGDDLVDVETSKIVNTITAADSGILRAILANPGDTLSVGAVLGVIADASVAEADIASFIASHGGQGDAQKPAEHAETVSPKPGDKPTTVSQPAREEKPATSLAADLATLSVGEDDSNVPASPVARRLAKAYGVNLHNVTGTGRHGRVSKKDLESVVVATGGQLIPGPPSTSAHPPLQREDRLVRATPVARRLANELGINLYDCRVSGERGRVCKADVEAIAALKNITDRQPAGSEKTGIAEEPFELHALSGMRKTIASRLQESKQNSPHFRVQIDAEIDSLLAVRKQINDAHTEARVSVNDFLVKACATALMKVPALNVQFDGESLKHFRTADISVAVAIDDGLITPIVRTAESKGLVAISNEIRDLATRAKLGRLKPDEFQGGSFCISNLGMYGIKQFDAIINPPQGAILAVGAGEQRPVVKQGQLGIATVVSLTLSSDHRIIDGAVAAQFMAVLKGYLEQPATMLG